MLKLISKAISEYGDWLPYLALGSIIFLILSILLTPKMIALIPSDYFTQSRRKSKTNSFSIFRLGLLFIKNTVGALLMVSGILMLVLPGQGLLTIFASLLLLDFPGKYKFERYLIKKPAILNSLNWIRRKQNVVELSID